jgi:hypothetical protein
VTQQCFSRAHVQGRHLDETLAKDEGANEGTSDAKNQGKKKLKGRQQDTDPLKMRGVQSAIENWKKYAKQKPCDGSFNYKAPRRAYSSLAESQPYGPRGSC